jgi:acetolactate decarboxylase
LISRARTSWAAGLCADGIDVTVSELQFLGALQVELIRHGRLRPEHPDHELFQTSTVQALLAGAFEGDMTLGELLEHGDTGLGTLNGLDGELIVVDGRAWKANLDGTLTHPDSSCRTPYAVVVSFVPGEGLTLKGPFSDTGLEPWLAQHGSVNGRPTAIRIQGSFDMVRVRSVAKQELPYPPLADAIAQQRVIDLADVSGTMVGFCFPDALDGIEMVGSHLHFATDDRTMGGHVLSYRLRDAIVHLDVGSRLHVELPPAVGAPRHGVTLDQAALRRLETDAGAAAALPDSPS